MRIILASQATWDAVILKNKSIMSYFWVKKKFKFVDMSDTELLEDDSFNANSKQPSKYTEEATNADLFSLLKTYMNDKLSGIENNLNE